MPSNISQTEEVGSSATINISNIDSQYYNTSKDLYQAYAKIDDGQRYLEDATNDTLHHILFPDGGEYLSLSNCSVILKKLSQHYNLTTSALGSFLSRGQNVEHRNAEEVEVRKLLWYFKMCLKYFGRTTEYSITLSMYSKWFRHPEIITLYGIVEYFLPFQFIHVQNVLFRKSVQKFKKSNLFMLDVHGACLASYYYSMQFVCISSSKHTVRVTRNQ